MAFPSEETKSLGAPAELLLAITLAFTSKVPLLPVRLICLLDCMLRAYLYGPSPVNELLGSLILSEPPSDETLRSEIASIPTLGKLEAGLSVLDSEEL